MAPPLSCRASRRITWRSGRGDNVTLAYLSCEVNCCTSTGAEYSWGLDRKILFPFSLNMKSNLCRAHSHNFYARVRDGCCAKAIATPRYAKWRAVSRTLKHRCITNFVFTWRFGWYLRRWYAVLIPEIPPPMMTTSAAVGNLGCGRPLEVDMRIDTGLAPFGSDFSQ